MVNFNLDYGVVIKTVRVDGVQIKIKIKMMKNKKKNYLKHWATGFRS